MVEERRSDRTRRETEERVCVPQKRTSHSEVMDQNGSKEKTLK